MICGVLDEYEQGHLPNFLVSTNSFGSSSHNNGSLHATDEIKYNFESLTSPLSEDINNL